MFRETAIAVVALAAFDLYCLDGRYVHAVKVVVLSLLNQLLG